MGLPGAAPQEHLFLHLVVHQRAHLFGQAPLGNHLAGDARGPLDIVGGTGGDTVLAQGHLLGDAATEQAADLADDEAAAVAVAVLFRQEHGNAQGAAAGDDAHLVDRVVLRHQPADDGMPRLVVGRIALLVFGHDHGFALGAHHDLVLGELELGHAHGADIGARRKQGGLVDQVGQVGAGEPGRAAGNLGSLDILGQGDLAHVHLENLFAAADIGQADDHLAVKTAGAQQGGVQHVRAVGGGDDDDAVIHLEAIHFHQQLVQCLFAFVVPAAQAGTPVASHRVDLVDENDTGGLLLGLLEHVPHPRGADTDEHLHEIRAGDGEKRHLGLTGDSLRQQRLAGTGLAHHQYAARYAPAQFLEAAGIAQELDQFLDVLLGLVHPRHIGEGGGDLVFTQQPRLALAKAHGAAATTAAALHLAHEEHEYGDDDQDGEAGHQQLGPDTLLFRLAAHHFDVVFQQVVDQLGILDHGADGLKAGAVVTLTGNGKAVHHDFLHLLGLDFLDELGISHLLGLALHIEVVEDRQQNRSDHQPEQQIFNHIVQYCYLTKDS